MKPKKPHLYLKRKIDAVLCDWKSHEDRLPLIITGARQVGKTECVRHFAEGRYESVIEINFFERPEFKAIVRDGYSVQSIVKNISMIEPSVRFCDGSTLIFFDEIQESLEVATAFKFFAQDESYDVIASGSLLEFTISASKVSASDIRKLWNCVRWTLRSSFGREATRNGK